MRELYYEILKLEDERGKMMQDTQLSCDFASWWSCCFLCLRIEIDPRLTRVSSSFLSDRAIVHKNVTWSDMGSRKLLIQRVSSPPIFSISDQCACLTLGQKIKKDRDLRWSLVFVCICCFWFSCFDNYRVMQTLAWWFYDHHQVKSRRWVRKTSDMDLGSLTWSSFWRFFFTSSKYSNECK